MARIPLLLPAAIATLALLLTGCVPEPETQATGSVAPTVSVSPAPTGSGAPASPSPSATPTAEPSSTPPSSATPRPSSPVEAALTLPSCDDLIPLSVVQAGFGETGSPMQGVAAPESVMSGPLAKETVANARSSRVCAWLIPSSDGGFAAVAADITVAARDRLISGLRSSSSYTETTVGGSTAFTQADDSDFGSVSLVYAFRGNAWVTVTGTLSMSTAKSFAKTALASVSAAN